MPAQFQACQPGFAILSPSSISRYFRLAGIVGDAQLCVDLGIDRGDVSKLGPSQSCRCLSNLCTWVSLSASCYLCRSILARSVRRSAWYRFPECFNDPATVSSVVKTLREALGPDSVEITPPGMGSEDVGHLGASIGVPSVIWWFGGMPAEVFSGPGPIPLNHSPFFAPIWKALWPPVSPPQSRCSCPDWATHPCWTQWAQDSSPDCDGSVGIRGL